jgi:hypothetical protein
MFHRAHIGLGNMARRLGPRRQSILTVGTVAGLLLAVLFAVGSSRAAVPVSFGKSMLHNETSAQPTSLQFGPDGRLYVAQRNGIIRVYTVRRNGANNYSVTATNNISLIRNIPNHDDDGTLNPEVTDRQVTGILVKGTAANPVIYVTSSDPRQNDIKTGGDLNLDTNSSMLSRLRWTGSNWSKVDLVRGLPHSENNHAINGMQLDTSTNMLYVAEGGHTNMGAPSHSFGSLPEYAYSAAILKIDLDAIGNTTYDLPTLDDEDRPGNPDVNDPFGGNDGKNQAKIVADGPVQVYAPGFRNAYDLLIAKSGKMYTVDNNHNSGEGAVPINEGPQGECTNQVNEPGVTAPETLHLVKGQGYYGGHPNPTRGNKANTFNAGRQSPILTNNPVECDYRAPGAERGNIGSFNSSTNGLAEYTASNFGGAMKGNLLAASFENRIYRVKLNSTGDDVALKEALFSSVGIRPLDVIAQSDTARFPGTIWVADIGSGAIKVFEPGDYGGSGGTTCNPADDPNLDADGDGFSNADEIDNATNPCSNADRPPDFDGDKTSNRNDPDDDNDGLPDTSDPFAVDRYNGTITSPPLSYTWDNDAPSPGGILNLGFTGLMTNEKTNYAALYDPAKMTAAGAAGRLTVDAVPEGDAWATDNSQRYGFQFGIKAPTRTFTAHTEIEAPFAGMTPEDYQSMGLFVGRGNQNNYAKLVTAANGGAGGIEFAKEVGGTFVRDRPRTPVSMPGPDAVDLFLTVDPVAQTVQPSYAVTINGVTGQRMTLGSPERVPAGWFDGSTGFAIGIISTSSGPGPVFPATWNFIEVTT